MTIAHHKKTTSNGSGNEAKAYRGTQANLIMSDDYCGAVHMDVADVTRIDPKAYLGSISLFLYYTSNTLGYDCE